jgi:hypothetical protein
MLHRAIIPCEMRGRRTKLLAGALALLTAVIAGCSLGTGLPPVVSYTTPADGSGNVPVAATISASFSRPMDPSTITAGSFTVQLGGVPVAGTVTYSGRTATFTPSAPLLADSLYTATMTTAATDPTGIALASSRVWTFATVPTPTPNNMVLYYAYTFGANPWTRSSVPVTLTNAGNTVSQSYNPAIGAVTLTITNATPNEDNGFYLYAGSLQYFTSLTVTAAGGSGPFSANIYLDVDNDGEFFTWTPSNTFSSFGADAYFVGPSSVGGVLAIGTTSVFGPYTLAQIKAGAVPGTSPRTRIAIWVGFGLSSGSQTTTINTVQLN